MNKFNYLFALLLGALVSFTSCDKDDDLSPEELEANQTEELIGKLEYLLNPRMYDSYTKRIKAAAQLQVFEVESMWDEIEQFITNYKFTH